jgi:hypothetical protein
VHTRRSARGVHEVEAYIGAHVLVLARAVPPSKCASFPFMAGDTNGPTQALKRGIERTRIAFRIAHAVTPRRASGGRTKSPRCTSRGSAAARTAGYSKSACSRMRAGDCQAPVPPRLARTVSGCDGWRVNRPSDTVDTDSTPCRWDLLTQDKRTHSLRLISASKCMLYRGRVRLKNGTIVILPPPARTEPVSGPSSRPRHSTPTARHTTPPGTWSRVPSAFGPLP